MEQGIITIGVGVAVGLLVAVTLWLIKLVGVRRNWESHRITLPIRSNELPQWMTAHVRHIRDGEGPPINKDYEFKKSNDKGEFEIFVRSRKCQGFQYKCYIDFSIGKYEEAKRILEQLELTEITLDGEVENRLWFLIPGRPISNTKAGFRNNVNCPK